MACLSCQVIVFSSSRLLVSIPPHGGLLVWTCVSDECMVLLGRLQEVMVRLVGY